MCVVSMVMDHYRDRWTPQPPWPDANPLPYVQPVFFPPQITPEEIAEFKRLLDRAREYDKRHNEPNCELNSKKDAIRKLAQDAGFNIEFL